MRAPSSSRLASRPRGAVSGSGSRRSCTRSCMSRAGALRSRSFRRGAATSRTPRPLRRRRPSRPSCRPPRGETSPGAATPERRGSGGRVLTGAFEPPTDGQGAIRLLAFDSRDGRICARVDAQIDDARAGATLVGAFEQLWSGLGGEIGALQGLRELGWESLESVLRAERCALHDPARGGPHDRLAAMLHFGRAIEDAPAARYPAERLAWIALETAQGSAVDAQVAAAGVRALERALDDAPAHAELDEALAALLIRLGRPQDAEQRMNAAIATGRSAVVPIRSWRTRCERRASSTGRTRSSRRASPSPAAIRPFIPSAEWCSRSAGTLAGLAQRGTTRSRAKPLHAPAYGLLSRGWSSARARRGRGGDADRLGARGAACPPGRASSRRPARVEHGGRGPRRARRGSRASASACSRQSPTTRRRRLRWRERSSSWAIPARRGHGSTRIDRVSRPALRRGRRGAGHAPRARRSRRRAGPAEGSARRAVCARRRADGDRRPRAPPGHAAQRLAGLARGRHRRAAERTLGRGPRRARSRARDGSRRDVRARRARRRAPRARRRAGSARPRRARACARG